MVSIKDTNYAIPSGAYFVSPNGNDANSGNQSSPWRTIGKALASAPAGATVVIRNGTYREGDLTFQRKMALQPYPHEKPWIKGSLVVTDWVAENSIWRKDNWNYQFEPIPANSSSIDPEHPMAAYRDMVFINGKSLKQVGSKAAVGPGEFYVDYAHKKLYIGDNPSNKTVEATAFETGINIKFKGSQDSLIRGIGFAHYAEEAVGVYMSNIALENNTFAWNGISGLGIHGSTDIVVRGNTLSYNGRKGLTAKGADRTLIEGNTISFNNVALFAMNWDAAGAKFIKTDSLVLRDNIFEHNQSHGLWIDVSSTNAVIVRNIARHNERDGIFFEVSNNAIIASNLVVENARNGINVFDSSNAKVYNNTVSKSPVCINIVEGSRTNTNSQEVAAGITWKTKNNVVKNNILSNTEGLTSDQKAYLLNVFNDFNSDNYSLVTAVNYNGYYRTSATKPEHAIRYRPQKKLLGNAVNFKTVQEFSSSTSFEKNALAIDNAATNPFFVNESQNNYRLKSESPAIGRGEPLPADVASAIGVQPGVKVNLGALDPVGPGVGAFR